jgi:hypothetical protein
MHGLDGIGGWFFLGFSGCLGRILRLLGGLWLGLGNGAATEFVERDQPGFIGLR